VVDDRNVEYKGKTMSLTALAKLLPGKKYSSPVSNSLSIKASVWTISVTGSVYKTK